MDSAGRYLLVAIPVCSGKRGLNSTQRAGGNAMSVDRKRGVVDTGFKVHDVDDLYVCDASVFPTSIKVNPQWTVMALAELCAEEILGDL